MKTKRLATVLAAAALGFASPAFAEEVKLTAFTSGGEEVWIWAMDGSNRTIFGRQNGQSVSRDDPGYVTLAADDVDVTKIRKICVAKNLVTEDGLVCVDYDGSGPIPVLVMEKDAEQFAVFGN